MILNYNDEIIFLHFLYISNANYYYKKIKKHSHFYFFKSFFIHIHIQTSLVKSNHGFKSNGLIG